MVTDEIPEIVSLSAELPMVRDMDFDFYMRQEGKGLLAGPWESDCRVAWGGQSAPWAFGQELFDSDFDRLESNLEMICRSVPAFAAAGLKRTVNGAISFSPDARPMIGPLPGVPGFFVACGFLGGIAQGGGIGLAMSQWILEGETELDLAFIDVARFGDAFEESFVGRVDARIWTAPRAAGRVRGDARSLSNAPNALRHALSSTVSQRDASLTTASYSLAASS